MFYFKNFNSEQLHKLFIYGPPTVQTFPYINYIGMDTGVLLNHMVLPTTRPATSWSEVRERRSKLRVEEHEYDSNKAQKVVYFYLDGYDRVPVEHYETLTKLLERFLSGEIVCLHVLTGALLHGRDTMWSVIGNTNTDKHRFRGLGVIKPNSPTLVERKQQILKVEAKYGPMKKELRF